MDRGDGYPVRGERAIKEVLCGGVASAGKIYSAGTVCYTKTARIEGVMRNTL
jgi:hypothetical protein